MKNFHQLDARALKSALREIAAQPGTELALLDVSEEGQFGGSHLLRAVNVPYSQLELLIAPLVPRKTCRLVLMDQGDGVALLAAARLAAMDYRNISVFTGGTKAWQAAGGEVFSGVYVPSKAFGEWVEQYFGTPHIDAEELAAILESHADLIVLDPRTEAEHAAGHVPTAVSCPGAELIYRYADLVPSPKTLVVVACGGRTRGIVGAQTLINAGVPNRVVHLAGGNHGWRLSGRELERGLLQRTRVSAAGTEVARGRAKALGQRFDIRSVSEAQLQDWHADTGRTTFVFDVRTPGEYARQHHSLARNAPGGQLVQATDQWLGTLGARVVLVDSDGVRAIATAQWLRQMGWETYVLDAALDVAGAANNESGETGVGSLSPDEAARVRRELRGTVWGAQEIEPDQALTAIRAGALAVSLDRSVDYLSAHPPGAIWANRARLSELDEALRRGRPLILFSQDGRLAHLAAIDLRERAGASEPSINVVHGGQIAWTAAGLALEHSDDDTLPAERRIDFLQWAPGRRQGNKQAMQAYLNWEKNLLKQIAAEDFRFGLS